MNPSSNPHPLTVGRLLFGGVQGRGCMNNARGEVLRYLSVCSGIEAASVAWGPLGWTPVAFSEVERFSCAVLAHHYPDVPNVGDMTKIDGRRYHGTVDLLVGGTPCQDFSVAGKRAGLSGERSGLALDFIRLAREITPRWILWENVPGCLSTNGGIDFGSFAQALADCGYHLAYRILDAQFFGVPQRRRRVFLVGYLGDWQPAAAVLFEPHSLRRDTPPCRKKREDVTPSITASLGTGGPDDNRAQDGFYVPEIVGQATSCKWSKGTSGPAGDEHHNLVSQYGDIAGALTRRHDSSPCADRGMTVLCVHGTQDPDVLEGVAHTIGRNQGQEACIAIHPHCIGRGPDAGPQGKEYLNDGSAYTMDTKSPQAVAFVQNQLGEVRTGSLCGTLTRNSNASGRNTPIVFTEVAPTVGASGPPYSRTGNERVESEAMVLCVASVRRLTPRECERLQGFPDDYTNIPGASDSARYKALGNSMAVPVMRWIGERIQKWENMYAD